MQVPYVSIRARSLQSGRLSQITPPRANSTFQSAPALCRAGDSRASGPITGSRRFQSAPALCRAGDPISAACRSRHACFNPRPLFAERATPRCQVVVAKAEGRHFARTRVAASHDDTATRHAKVRDQVIRCAAPCANLPALRRRTGFARQTTSGPSKSVARKRPYSLTRSSVGSVMR